MSNIEKTKLFKSFRQEVLIQDEYINIPNLVKWFKHNNVNEFKFSTSSTSYMFEANPKGVVYYVYPLDNNNEFKIMFASYEEFLPDKNYYAAPKLHKEVKRSLITIDKTENVGEFLTRLRNQFAKPIFNS